MPTTTLRRVLAKLPGVVESDSMFIDGPAFWVNGKEIAHFGSDTHLEIRVTRAEIRARKASLAEAGALVWRRAPSSDWLVVDTATKAGRDLAIELVGRAAVIHAPPAGVAAAAPPTGSRLASLRRFH